MLIKLIATVNNSEVKKKYLLIHNHRQEFKKKYIGETPTN